MNEFSVLIFTQDFYLHFLLCIVFCVFGLQRIMDNVLESNEMSLWAEPCCGLLLHLWVLCVKTDKSSVHLKIKILSSFTHTHVIPYLHDLLSSVEHKNMYMYFLIVCTFVRTIKVSVVQCCFGLHCLPLYRQIILQNNLFCVPQRNKRHTSFETT